MIDRHIRIVSFGIRGDILWVVTMIPCQQATATQLDEYRE